MQAKSRFTKEERKALWQSLVTRQPVDEFRNRVDALNLTVDSEQLFNDPRADIIQEAIAASVFAQCVGASHINLINATRPDFELVIDGHTYQFELTEADLEGRVRGKEYASMTGDTEVLDDPVEEWEKRAFLIPKALWNAAKNKLGKDYSPSTNLLIYLNINEYGAYQDNIEQIMATSTANAKDKFHRVWVLWKEKAHLLWDKGERANAVYRHPRPLELA